MTKDELADEGEYNEIVEDMRDECGKYGTVSAIGPCAVMPSLRQQAWSVLQ